MKVSGWVLINKLSNLLSFIDIFPVKFGVLRLLKGPEPPKLIKIFELVYNAMIHIHKI